MRAKAIPVVILAVFLAVVSTYAHHGNAEFDLTQSVSLKATIADFVWSNPHSVLFFDVRGDNGKVTRWSCETVQPALLHRAGWTKDSLKAGDQVTVVLHPAKNGKPVGYLQKVILANGDELKLGQL
jgi:uncharacterized protein DUF6152